jgi:hypothetical protein
MYSWLSRPHSVRRAIRAVGFTLLFFATFSVCQAQFGASVQGSTQDSAAGLLPGAKISLVNRDTGVSQSTVSDARGEFRITSLGAGNYEIGASATGFAAVKINFILQTNEQRNIPLVLAIGSVATNVIVSSEAPLLDTSDSRTYQTFSTQALTELPIAARNPESVVTLAPGVVGKGTGGATNFNVENYNDASANGRGANGNQYILDGLDATSNARAGVLNMTPNVDVLSEVTVQINRYDVDFARTSSIQTVMTTKGGTKQFHGFASIYYTWQALYAKPEFSHPAPGAPDYPPFHILNTSFGVGGPIWRKREFFFFFAIQPYRSITSNTGSVYSYEDPAFIAFAKQARPSSFGTTILSTYPVSNVVTTAVSSTALQLFGPTNTAANTGCATPSTDNIPCSLAVIDNGTFNAQNYNNAKQYNVRLDKNFAKDRLYATVFRNTSLSSTAALRSAFTTTLPLYSWAYQANETHDFSAKLLNEGMFGETRIEGINNASGVFTVPSIAVTSLGTGFGIGSPLQDYVQHGYHWRDVLSYQLKSHNLKFGYEGLHARQESFFAPNGAHPTFSYTNLINFINDNPFSETALSYDSLSGLPSPSQNFYANSSFGLFAEDAWQVNRKLTLNYGIRYDNFGNAEPINGTKFSNFYLGSGSTLEAQVANGRLVPQTHYFQHDMNWIFSPRVGVALDPFGNGKYVIRGGFGLYHDFFNINNAMGGAKTNPPSYVIPTFFNNGSTAPPILALGTSNTFPFGFPYPKFVGQTLTPAGGIVGSQIAVGGSYQNLKPETTMIYSGGIERQLARNMVASITYSGSRSYNLWTAGINPNSTFYGQDVNNFPGDLVQHISCTGAGASNKCAGTLTRANPSFGAITYTLNGARQNYNAVIVAVKGRFAQRGFITASYMHSRDMDNALTYPTPNVNLYYGPSSYDVPNRVSVGANYQLKGLNHDSGLIGRLTGGYTISGIVALQSGQPFTVYTSSPFAATLINPSLPASATNLQYTSGTGDYNADGVNMDYPNVSSYSQSHSRSAYIKGIFPICSGGNLNNCGPFTQPQFGQEGNEGVNLFRSPGFAETDLTLEKITKIHEQINFRLRVEMYNAFNRVNLNPIDANANDTTFGTSTGTSTPRYLLLGARVDF